MVPGSGIGQGRRNAKGSNTIHARIRSPYKAQEFAEHEDKTTECKFLGEFSCIQLITYKIVVLFIPLIYRASNLTIMPLIQQIPSLPIQFISQQFLLIRV